MTKPSVRLRSAHFSIIAGHSSISNMYECSTIMAGVRSPMVEQCNRIVIYVDSLLDLLTFDSSILKLIQTKSFFIDLIAGEKLSEKEKW